MSATRSGFVLYAGIDGGATGCRCIVARGDGSVLGRAAAGSANPLRMGIDAAAASLLESIEGALNEAGAVRGDLAAVCLGVAGTRRGRVARDLARELEKHLAAVEIAVITDALAAFTGGVPDGVGVIALAGTGFVAFGMNGREKSGYADGLGPLLGDEGSAHSIGREALRSVAREIDRRGPATGFADSVLEFLHVDDLDSMVRLASTGVLDTARIAALAPLVMSACDAGSAEAGSILDAAASRIADSVRVVAVDLDLVCGNFPVVLGGGLLEVENPLRGRVEELIKRGIPGASIMRPFLPPEAGALAIAMTGGDASRLVESLEKLKLMETNIGPDRHRQTE